MEKIQFKAGRIHFRLAVGAEGDIAGRHKFGNLSHLKRKQLNLSFLFRKNALFDICKNFA